MAVNVPPLDPSETRKILRQAWKNDWEVGTFIIACISAFLVVVFVLPVCLIKDSSGVNHPWWCLMGIIPVFFGLAAYVIWRAGSTYMTEFPDSTGEDIRVICRVWRKLPEAEQKTARPLVDRAWKAGLVGDTAVTSARRKAITELAAQLSRAATVGGDDLDSVQKRAKKIKDDLDAEELAQKIARGEFS